MFYERKNENELDIEYQRRGAISAQTVITDGRTDGGNL